MNVKEDIKNTIKILKDMRKFKSQEAIAQYLGYNKSYFSRVMGEDFIPIDFENKFFEAFPKSVYLNQQNRQIQPNREIDTVDEINIPDFVAEDDVIYNSFNNKFEKLPNGEYLMYMPLFEWDVAAGLLDHDGDTRHPDYEDVAQHVVVVKEPLKGKYSAFRIKGGSMEGTEVNRYIPDGSIVWGRELQRIHWEYPLRLSRFPLWVIGSTDFGRPTLKEIISHDVTTATIVVDSWNPSIEYAHNVPISLNTVKMLYYVFKIETPVADIY